MAASKAIASLAKDALIERINAITATGSGGVLECAQLFLSDTRIEVGDLPAIRLMVGSQSWNDSTDTAIGRTRLKVEREYILDVFFDEEKTSFEEVEAEIEEGILKSDFPEQRPSSLLESPAVAIGISPAARESAQENTPIANARFIIALHYIRELGKPRI